MVLVTGASSGIGLATCAAAAAAGLRVVATVRDLSRTAALEAALAGRDATIVDLDVTVEDSVMRCIDGVIASHGRLDVLVNNAGAAHLSTLELDTLAGIRRAMEVNFFGVVAMSKAALPHLRESRGRLLTVTSVGGIIGQPFNEAYCAAKFAVEGFMESLAPVAASVGVRVSVIEPGAVASSFLANAGVDPQDALEQAGVYRAALAGYLNRTAGAFSRAQTPEAAAAVVLATMLATEPAFRVQTSDAATSLVGVKLADLDGSGVQALTSSWVATP